MPTLTELGAALSPPISKMAVSRGAKHRLPKTLVRGANGRAAGVTNLADAIAEWNANGDYTDAPQRSPGVVALSASPVEETDPDLDLSLAGAAARSKHWEAEMRELKFKQAAGELVPAAEVRKVVSDAFSACRSSLLAIPSRYRQSQPTLTTEAVLELENLVRESLEHLAVSGRWAVGLGPE